MMGMRPKDKEKITARTGKSKTFGVVFAITVGARDRTACDSGGLVTESKSPPVQLGDLMLKLEQIDKTVKSGKQDREKITDKRRWNIDKSRQ